MNLNFLRNNIFLISVGLVIAGVTSLLISVSVEHTTDTLLFLKEILGVITFGMTGLSVGTGWFLELLFYILLLVGAARFARDPAKNAIAGLVYSCIFIQNLCNVIYYPLVFILNPDYFNLNLIQIVTIALVSGLVSLLSYRILKVFVDQRVPLVAGGYQTNNKNIEYVPATHTQRLLHFVVDMGLLLLLFLGPAQALGHLIFPHPVWFSGHFGVVVLFLLFRFAYYYIQESRFGVTPGKFVNQTALVGSPDILDRNFAILLRTTVRFIPFDSLSFLGFGNWHDTWSKTQPVRMAGKKKKEPLDVRQNLNQLYNLNRELRSIEKPFRVEDIELITLEYSVNGKKSVLIKLYKYGKVSRYGAGGMASLPFTGTSIFEVNHVFNNLLSRVTHSMLNPQEEERKNRTQGPVEHRIAFYGLPENLSSDEHLRWGKHLELKAATDTSLHCCSESDAAVIRLVNEAVLQTQLWYYDVLIFAAYEMKSIKLPDQTHISVNHDDVTLGNTIRKYLSQVLKSSADSDLQEMISDGIYIKDGKKYRAVIVAENAASGIGFEPLGQYDSENKGRF